MKMISYNNLIPFVQKILNKAGLDNFSSNAVTLCLCEASLRGVDTHGVRLLPHYVKSAFSGRKNPKPTFKFSKNFSALGILDANNAFGHAAGMKAIEHCIDLANDSGVGIVSVKNSSHSGAMASIALQAARKGFITFALTHSDPFLLTPNGQRPYFGTNPICVAVPREEKEPYCLDMAMSMISWNKVMLCKSKREDLPNNAVADINGDITTDPEKAAFLMPAGAYKGFGLASIVEILCGVFTGMNFGRDIPGMYTSYMEKPRQIGQFFMVIRSDGCLDQKQFLKRMQEMTNQVRNEPSKTGGEIILPGDRAIKIASQRKKEGIPIDIDTFKELNILSKDFNVSFDTIDT